MIYVVTEEAVYRHRILGVYDMLEAAEARAFQVALLEDGHHEYAVSSASMNEGMADVTAVCYFKRERVGNQYPRQWTDPVRHTAALNTGEKNG